jgi:hypothetical protein
MSQASYNVPTGGSFSMVTFSGLMNGAYNALASKNAGASAPANGPGSAPQEFQTWFSTISVNFPTLTYFDGVAWNRAGTLDVVNSNWLPKMGGGVATLPSAATVDIGASPQTFITISGSVTIASFGTAATVGEEKKLQFSGSPQITFNAGAIVTPTLGNINAQPGDTCTAIYQGSGIWLIWSYVRATLAAAITNAGLANSAAWTLKGNNTGSPAAPQDFTINALTAKPTPVAADQVPIWDVAGAAMKNMTLSALFASLGSINTTPTVQRFMSGSGNYTPTTGTVRARVRMVAGGGGGGSANFASTTQAASGSGSSFDSWTCGAGSGGFDANAPNNGGTGGSGGANGTGTLIWRVPGGAGGGGAVNAGGMGGGTPLGAGGAAAIGNAGAGTTNSGAGGGGSDAGGSHNGGTGGAGGEYVEFWITAPGVTAYVVGGGGAGNTNVNGNGGNGAAGGIIVEEFRL